MSGSASQLEEVKLTEARDAHVFDGGWNKLRQTIFANQKRPKVIRQDAKLTPWPKNSLKEWDQLT